MMFQEELKKYFLGNKAIYIDQPYFYTKKIMKDRERNARRLRIDVKMQLVSKKYIPDTEIFHIRFVDVKASTKNFRIIIEFSPQVEKSTMVIRERLKFQPTNFMRILARESLKTTPPRILVRHNSRSILKFQETLNSGANRKSL